MDIWSYTVVFPVRNYFQFINYIPPKIPIPSPLYQTVWFGYGPTTKLYPLYQNMILLIICLKCYYFRNPVSATDCATQRSTDRRLGAGTSCRRFRRAVFLQRKTSADRKTQHGVHRQRHLVALHTLLWAHKFAFIFG